MQNGKKLPENCHVFPLNYLHFLRTLIVQILAAKDWKKAFSSTPTGITGCSMPHYHRLWCAPREASCWTLPPHKNACSVILCHPSVWMNPSHMSGQKKRYSDKKRLTTVLNSNTPADVLHMFLQLICRMTGPNKTQPWPRSAPRVLPPWSSHAHGNHSLWPGPAGV